MKQIEVPYGNGYQRAKLPETIPVQVIDLECPPFEVPVETLIEDALDHPIGTPKLETMVQPCDHVVIVINDQTRPGPNSEMASALITRLERAGVPDENISFLIATGSHRAPTSQELEHIIGKDLLKRIPVAVHDCKRNNVHVGDTGEGMPVYVDRLVAEASFVITTGLIAPHKAAGFSGGRKSIVPGVAGMETLRIHHSLPIRPYEPALGWYEENPFHRAALEAARKVKVRFMINAVQDGAKQNVAVVAGDLDLAHREGVRISRLHNTVECDRRGDLVITSPGGTPRDCNLYQGQKALATGEMFAEQSGPVTMILVARAEDGIGPELFQQWLMEGESPDDVIERFRREGFDVGTNKAFEYARALKKGRVIIVSENVDPERIRRMKLEWASPLQEAVDMALERHIPEQVIVLPRAVTMIPHFRG